MIKNRLRTRLRLSKRLINIFSALTLILTCLSSITTAETETPPAGSPEAPKSIMKIEVKDGLLSVELSDAEFGNVIKEIAEKARFKVEVSGDVAYKKISTNFRGVDIEKGIRRLLTIMKEKDYTISYNREGFIDKLEIYGGASSKPAVSSPQKRSQGVQKPVSPIVPSVTSPAQPPKFKSSPPLPQPEVPEDGKKE